MKRDWRLIAPACEDCEHCYSAILGEIRDGVCSCEKQEILEREAIREEGSAQAENTPGKG